MNSTRKIIQTYIYYLINHVYTFAMKLRSLVIIFNLIYNLILASDHDFTDDGECHCGKRDNENSSPWQILIQKGWIENPLRAFF